MFATERRQNILEFVRVNGAASLRDIAAAVNSSEVTVRRDIRMFVEQGLLTGGAAARSGRMTCRTSRATGRRAAWRRRRRQQSHVSRPPWSTKATRSGGRRHHHTRIGDRAEPDYRPHGGHQLGTGRAGARPVEGRGRGDRRLAPRLNVSLVGSVAEQSLAKVRVRYAFLSGNGLTADAVVDPEHAGRRHGHRDRAVRTGGRRPRRPHQDRRGHNVPDRSGRNDHAPGDRRRRRRWGIAPPPGRRREAARSAPCRRRPGS